MSFRVRVLGRLVVQYDGRTINTTDSSKAQELLCYVLLHRSSSHARELLASLLWAESADLQARKNLRQTLWQLQSAFDAAGGSAQARLLQQDADRVSVNPAADLWLDAAELEQAYAAVQRTPGRDLDDATARAVAAAVDLYEGDLLEGCYQDWCLVERERLQVIYIALLDALIGFHAARRQYESGLTYGGRVLQLDHARERTHRQMMRLHYLAGDRTAALRQFDRCAAALQRELNVRPARQTRALYEQIRVDQLDGDPSDAPAAPAGGTEGLALVVRRLKDLHVALAGIDQQVLEDIEALERRPSTRP